MYNCSDKPLPDFGGVLVVLELEPNGFPELPVPEGAAGPETDVGFTPAI